ncbi:MAG: D-alanine--D-alanine ligase [Bacteroidia bacterium]
MKTKIGVIFGGVSREREISFAGGRTVYDNLNKSLFEAIPIFVDSFGNFVLLNWQYIYKGSIRDFYPPVEFIPQNKGDFQIYAESLGNLNKTEQLTLIEKIGKKIAVEELSQLIDFAFLCLHGPYGEDGTIQGIFDYYHIPYSGSGIFPSAFGVNKAIQKRLMVNAGFNSPAFMSVKRAEYISGNCKSLYTQAKSQVGLPMVIKPANQGSSIGVTILHQDDEMSFMQAVEKAFFTKWIDANEWNLLSDESKNKLIKELTDIREGIGLPIKIENEILYHPYDLKKFIDERLKTKNDGLILEAIDGESEVLIEGFIKGREFSCIVVQDEHGVPVALPPTEIKKGTDLFDYRSKYLPGLSRKITPIDLPEEQIEAIRKECERLFTTFNFDVYARIDGFITADNTIYLNDPNTTSGMMPSSFFFHQAAEIGLNPSQFLTYIIRTSLKQRVARGGKNLIYQNLLSNLDAAIKTNTELRSKKIKIAVILGGYSSERHISVESGRNIYEKLSSSEKYEPFPVFLTGNDQKHELFLIPVNVLLKDNADDIKEKVYHYKQHPIIKKIIAESGTITNKYVGENTLFIPQKISYEQLAKMADGVFIALHGRPGEDGALQKELERVGLPYNGSGQESSSITINKFKTNEILKLHGLLVAEHTILTKQEWISNKEKALARIKSQFNFPFIAKPVDDGCSSAVKKIKNEKEFEAFANQMFRDIDELLPNEAEILQLKANEEFPRKNEMLIEELISKKDAKHFLEITGGMLTRFNEKGEIEYEVFEASEALVEGEVLSLEEKFLAGQGQNITPARYAIDPIERQAISDKVKQQLEKAARILNVVGYCRIDAFVRIYDMNRVEVIFIEVNSLPGMTPATCIFHQTAIQGYKPYDFIDRILDFGFKKSALLKN